MSYGLLIRRSENLNRDGVAVVVETNFLLGVTMDVEEFDAIYKDGAKQAQLSRLLTRFDAKYQDYYAAEPGNCVWPGFLV